MPILDMVLQLFFGTVIGCVIGMTSIGAGALVLPTLTVVLGMSATVAIGTASLYGFLIKLFASYRHFQLKTVDIRVTACFLFGAVPADAAVSWFVSRHAVQLRGQAEAMHVFQGRLTVLIALVVLFCATILLLQVRKKDATHGTAYRDACRSHTGLRIASIAIPGAFVGAVMGATGIGGGVLVVPVLIMAAGLSSAKTVGTSVFIALFLSLLTAFVYVPSNETDVKTTIIKTAIIMTIGGWIGAYFGSHLTTRIPDRPLKLIIASIVMLAAIMMLVMAFKKSIGAN